MRSSGAPLPDLKHALEFTVLESDDLALFLTLFPNKTGKDASRGKDCKSRGFGSAR
jgi:hypothetical protein